MLTISNLVLNSIKKNGKKIALYSSGKKSSLSFDDVFENACKIALKIEKSGYKKGDFIAIILDRNINFIQSIITCAAFGYPFIPIDKNYPKERIDYILNDSGAKAIIDDDFLESCKNIKITEKDKLHYLKNNNSNEKDKALIIYTSGSTGKPKGVLHTQRSIAEGVLRFNHFSDFKDSDIYACSVPFTFIVSMMDILNPFINGVPNIVIPSEVVRDYSQLDAFITENKISHLFMPPKILRYFEHKGNSLRTVFCGGEKISMIGPKGFRIISSYGLSETSACIYFNIDKPYEKTPLGNTVDNVKAYILDEEGNESSLGEICLTGNFFEEYLHLPEQTSKVKVKNPFVDRDGNEYLFHTGDIAERLEDGNIYYLNRKDWMVKINGQRVEPGEIEVTIRQIPQIVDACVKDFVNDFGQTYLCGYYVCREEINDSEIREFLAKKLPPYMIPLFLIELEKMPLNQNGKLDRFALKAPDLSLFKKEYTAPKSKLQKQLCTAFEKVLAVEKVGIDDDFFTLGGDSIRTIALCKECHDLSLSTKIILEGKTPRLIARILTQQNLSAKKINYQKITKATLTESQLGIFLDCNSEKLNTKYNIPFELSYNNSEIDAKKLCSAIQKVISNYSVFSTVINISKAEPFMEISNQKLPELLVEEMSEKDYINVKEKIVQPFSFEKGFLFRIRVIKTEKKVYVLFDIHHILFDGTSLNVFEKAIMNAYNGKELEKESISPYNQSEIEQNAKNTKRYKKCLEYFNNYLANVETESTLIPDLCNKIDTNSEEKATVNIILPLLIFDVEQFARKTGITENTIFSAGFAYTLAKFNSQKECLFASVENGRSSSEYENSIGMFVRTFPVCINIDEEEQIAEYLGRVQNTIFNTISNDDISYSELIRLYKINSDVKFVYEGKMFNGITELPVKEAISKLDMMVLKCDNCYKVQISYKKSLYSKKFIQSFADSYSIITSQLILAESLKKIQLTTQTNLTIQKKFNQTDFAYNDNENVVQIINRMAKENGEKPAVIYKNRKITYNQLTDLSNRVAAFTARQKISKDDFVAILTSRNEYLPIASLGVLKAGAAYQPIDPTYPEERINFMIQDSDAKLLIVEKALYPIVKNYKGKILFAEEIMKLPSVDEQKIISLEKKITKENAFIIIYTSGTTGKPKGCILEHKNVVSFNINHTKIMHLDGESHVANYASFGFDAGVMDIFTTFMNGATLYIIPDEDRLDIQKIEQFYNENKITHGFITTQVGKMFAQNTKCPTLQYFLVGGEKLVPFTPQSSFKFINGYGPSECLAYVTHFEVKDDSIIQPIGKPNLNVKTYITDNFGRILPIGACGELCISGPQVGRGYYKNLEKSNDVFIKNPFEKNNKYSRMYKTGDIVRYLSDGNIEFIGRRDGQVKIRGFRIELAEVDAAICEFEDIKTSKTIALTDNFGGKYLASYVVSKDNKKIDIDKLKKYLLKEKPSYMVPPVFMQLEKLPLNSNGKIDVKNLPLIEYSGGEFKSPKTENQKKLFECVKEIIGTDFFGIDTNLFEAGLSSIGLLRLNTQISKIFNLNIRTREIKENETIEKLEAFIQKNIKNATNEYPVFPDYPLSKVQEGIFVECQFIPNSTVYNIPLLLKLGDNINLKKLENSICEVINAHPILNTHLFYDTNGEIRMQRSVKKISKEQKIVEYSDSIKNLVKPFELIGGQLFRVKIIKTKSGNYLFIDVHHIIFDGSSLSVLLNDIQDAYNGQKINLEEFTPFEMVLEEQKDLKSPAYTNAGKYFADLLDGIDGSFLPGRDIPFGNETGNDFYTEKSTFNKQQIELFCKQNISSVNGLLNAAFGYTLAQFNGTEKSVYTTIYNGRNDSRTLNMVGMLVKTLPVVCKAYTNDSDNADNTICSFVNNITNQITQSMTNDIFSFAEISHEFGVKADVIFVYQGNNFNFEKFCGENCKIIDQKLSDAKAPLTFQVSLSKNEYVFYIEYEKSLYSKKFIQSFTQSFNQVVNELLTKEYISEIEMLCPQQKKLLDKINKSEVSFDDSKTVIDLFKKQVIKNPEKIAVKFENKSLTYAKLDEISTKIAVYLKKRGLGKEDFVSILIGRNINMMTCPIGVLKTGAAYQPLDPSYPQERLNFMIKDCGAKYLICDKEYRSLLTEYNGEVLFTDQIDDLPEPNVNEINEIDSIKINHDDAIVILYTSGTTGLPKGCILEHKNIIYFTNFVTKRMGITEKTNSALYASFGFDANLMETYSYLSNGSTINIIPEDKRRDLVALESFFVKNEITNGFMTTQMGRLFLQETKCKTLKYFMFGGEKLTPFKPKLNISIINGYGPTECTCCITTYTVQDDSTFQPIGVQNENIKLYVVDKKGRELPVGAIGELCAAGPQVARGYLNRPEKNDSVFIKNPFCNKKEYSKLYKTGDIVRFLPDGNVDYIGRRDGQVKIRGFRVELSEIENVISEYEGIKSAVVIAAEETNGGKFLAAYFTADSRIDIESLKKFIGQKKPPYCIPASFMQLDALPLNVNGKVDKKKLPKPEKTSSREGAEAVNEVEKKLCEIYKDMLGLQKVYADDNFFEIGGTSITASQLVVKIVQAGFNVVFKNIFENPTPQKLAAFIRTGQTEDVFAPDAKNSKYDYSALNYNVLENLPKIKNLGVGDVLLTGGTGFLGSHVLKELLKNTKGKVVCIVRSKGKLSAENHLNQIIKYYFNDDIADEFEKRVSVVDASLPDEHLEEKLKPYSFDTIINCAANVRHFSNGDALIKDNLKVVEELIAIAKKRNVLLVQTSSLSVCGESVDGKIPLDFVFKEYNLNIGQSLENKYVRSKYFAEQTIINEISKGLKAKIVRFGNLMARNSDGEFQINFSTNGFMQQIKGYYGLGYFPVDMMDAHIEFSPIDYSAKALVLLSGTPSEFTVFHANNCHSIHLANVFEAMKKIGLGVEIVDSEIFGKKFKEMLNDEKKSSKALGLLNYMNSIENDPTQVMKYSADYEKELSKGEQRHKISSDNSFTTKALYRLGFSWPVVGLEYLEKSLLKLKELGFFDK